MKLNQVMFLIIVTSLFQMVITPELTSAPTPATVNLGDRLAFTCSSSEGTVTNGTLYFNSTNGYRSVPIVWNDAIQAGTYAINNVTCQYNNTDVVCIVTDTVSGSERRSNVIRIFINASKDTTTTEREIMLNVTNVLSSNNSKEENTNDTADPVTTEKVPPTPTTKSNTNAYIAAAIAILVILVIVIAVIIVAIVLLKRYPNLRQRIKRICCSRKFKESDADYSDDDRDRESLRTRDPFNRSIEDTGYGEESNLVTPKKPLPRRSPRSSILSRALPPELLSDAANVEVDEYIDEHIVEAAKRSGLGDELDDIICDSDLTQGTVPDTSEIDQEDVRKEHLEMVAEGSSQGEDKSDEAMQARDPDDQHEQKSNLSSIMDTGGGKLVTDIHSSQAREAQPVEELELHSTPESR